MECPWTADELAEILDQHGPALRLFAAQWSPAADDCVQDAMLKLIRQSNRPRNVVGWLYRVIRNRALSQRRSWTRRQRHEFEAGRHTPIWFEPDAATEFDSREAAEVLSQLTVDEREVIVARIWGGLSFDEIAEIIGVSRSAAHRRYHDALGALRMRLAPVKEGETGR